MSELENNEINPTVEEIANKTTENMAKINSDKFSKQPSIKINTKGNLENLGNINDDSFDYVIPSDSYKKHKNKSKQHQRHRKTHHRSSADRITPEEREAMSSGFVFNKQSKSHHHHNTQDRISNEDREAMASGFVFREYKKHKHHRRRHRHMAKGKKVAITIVSIILAVIILVVGSVLVINQVGKSQMHTLDTDDLDISVPQNVDGMDVVTEDNGATIKYNGHTYNINKEISTICFMGIDQRTTDATDENADFINLAAVDEKSKIISVIPISRETMCDINIYDDSGNFVQTENKQICLAFGYGKDEHDRCKNVMTSVSRLCYNIPIASYFALDLDAISILNDDIGGVTVTSNITFTSKEDGRTISEGEDVTLKGQEAEQYVRARDTSVLESNNYRMERQQQYLKSFLSTLVPAAKKDLGVITDLYGTVTTHSITDLTLPKITYLSSSALSIISSSQDINFKKIDGNIESGTNAEFYPDDKSLLETILSVFYIQID